MKKFLMLLMTALTLFTMTGKAQNTCVSPSNLNATLHTPEWNNVQLNWTLTMPIDSSDWLLNYGCTYGSNSIGTGSSSDFYGAVRFTPEDLASHNGMYLTAVTFVPAVSQTSCTYHIYIWQGGEPIEIEDEGETYPSYSEGTLVLNQEVTSPLAISVPNTIQLQTPVEIDVTQELCIGIRCVTTTGYPLGISTSTNLTDDAGLIAFHDTSLEWGFLSDFSLNYNWLIAGTLSNDPNPTVTTLTGFNVYRDNEFLATVETSNYLDSLDFGTYVYGVTAVYSDNCESEPVTKTVTLAPDPCTTCEDTLIIGTGTTMNAYLPTYMYYNYSLSEQIYTAEEIGELNGTIPCIGFQYNFATATNRHITIYMGNTSQSSFSNSPWIPGSELQQVFNGTVNFNNSADGHWVNIPLDMPFEYDGSSNIVVAVRDNTGSYLTSDARFLTHSATSKSRYVYNDNSPYDLNQLSNSGTVGNVRNNIRFMIGEPVACSAPAHLTVSEISSSSAVISWDENENSNGYELTIVQQGGSPEDVDPIVLNENTYEANELTPNTQYTVYLRSICSSDNSAYVTSTFHTVCLPETELPYVLNFDNMGTGSNVLPPCSERGMGGMDPSSPYVYNYDYAYSGNATLVFNNNYGPVMIRLAGLDLTENEQPLVMSFYEYKSYSSYGEVMVGFMTDPSDYSSFVPVKHYYPEDVPTNIWKEFRFGLPDSVNGRVIYPTIVSPSDNYSYFYIDDVTISVGNENCFAPENLQVSNVAYVSAQVSWTPVNPNATYLMHYTIEGDEVAVPVELEEGATSHLLTDLTAGTTYNVYMYSDCENTTDTAFVAFTTQSNSVIVCLSPDTTLQPINAGTAGTAYTIPINTFYNYSYTQQIYTAEEIGEEQVLTAISFYYDYATALTCESDVDIYLAHCSDSVFANSSAWLPINSATKVYEGPLNCTQGWNTFEFNKTLFNYNGTSNLALIINNRSGDYLGSSYVFKTHTKTSGTYRTIHAYNDNNEYDLTTPPAGNTMAARNVVRFTGCSESAVIDITCFEPTVSVAAYDSTNITVEWVPGGDETQWVIEYMAEGDTLWTSEANVSNTNSYTIENLTAATNYLIRMRSVCSGSDSSDWVTIPAFTICEFIDVPYAEDFESVDADNDEFVPCWSSYASESYYLPSINSYYSQSGNQSLYIYSSYSSSYAILPRFNDDVAMDSLTVKFSLYTPYSLNTIEVGVMSDPNVPSTFVPVGSATTTSYTTWLSAEINTNNYSGNGQYIAFRTPSNTYVNIYVDDVYVTYYNPCQHPNNITLLNKTAESATLSWTPGAEEEEWEYVYGLAGTVDLSEAETQSVDNDTLLISGLTDNTTYDFYIRSICSEDATSDWESFTFTTACLPLIELPYVQNFDSMTTLTSNMSEGNSNLSDCWDGLTTGTEYTAYPWVYYSSYNSHSGNYSLAFNTYASSYSDYGSQYAFLPVIDPQVIPYEGLMLEFMMMNSSSNNTFSLVVGITEGVDISTFVPIDTVVCSSTSYEQKSVSFNGYQGNGNRIAIVALTPSSDYSSNYGYIDDIVLSAPTCIHPDNLVTIESTTTSVTLDWNERGSAENWIIEYGPFGFELGEGEMVAANAHPFTITDLTPSSNYTFYVRALCSTTDTSAYSNALFTTTQCEALALPYSEDFEDYVGTTYNDNHGVTPLCWTNISNNATYGAPHVVGSGSYYASHSGQQSLIFTCGDAGSTAYAALPAFDAPLNTLNLSFWRGMESTSYGTLTVGYVTDLDNIDNSFVAVTTIPSNSYSNNDTISVEFTGEDIPETGNICFRWVHTSSYWSCCIDDIYVTATDTTPAPPTPVEITVTTANASDITQTTATLNGTISNPDNVTITSKGFQWKATQGGTYQDVTVTTTGNNMSYELTNLTAGTNYTFRAFVITSDTTLYGETKTFTTEEEIIVPCATPTGLTATNITKESITISWNNVEGITWHIQYRPQDGQFTSADASTNSYELTGLTPETTYEIQVQADCGNGNQSEWSTLVSATTTVGINSYLENNVTLYPNPAKEYVDVRVDGDVNVTAMEVYDVYGKVIRTVVGANDYSPLRINVSDLSAGMYFVRVTTDQGVVTKRFVKK